MHHINELMEISHEYFPWNKARLTRLIRILTALLAIAFCWAHKTGEWLHKEVEPIKIKAHGRPAKSLFRYGLDFIGEAIFKVFYQFELFKECLVHITTHGNNKRPFAG